MSEKAASKPNLFIRIIGVFGELLITAGALLGLFIVWQLWWTNVEANTEQAAEVTAVQEQFGTVDRQKIGEPQTGEPPAFDHSLPVDAPMGVIHIPAFGYDHSTVVKNGSSNAVLDTGAFGHYEDTAYPGEIGNFSTAVHRDIYGARMLNVDKLKAGDAIVVETDQAWLVYKFVDYEIVNPTDVYVIAADPYQAKDNLVTGAAVTAPTRRLLTITTCHPPLISNQRWIVHAELDHWVKRSDGVPAELVDPAAAGEATMSDGGTHTLRDAISDALVSVEEAVTKNSKEA